MNEVAAPKKTHYYLYLLVPAFLGILKKTNSVALVRKRTTNRPSDRRLSAELVPILADRGCRVVSTTIDRSRYFLSSSLIILTRLSEPLIPDPLLLRKSGSAGNRTWELWICSQELWLLDHRGDPVSWIFNKIQNKRKYTNIQRHSFARINLYLQ
jgi:hypothetical protein